MQIKKIVINLKKAFFFTASTLFIFVKILSFDFIKNLIKKQIKSDIINQPISEIVKLSISPSVLVTRYRNKSIIKFETPPNSDNKSNTTCYIENKEGSDDNYFIRDLNFTTPIIKSGDRYEFLCEIKNKKVYEILMKNN